mmetsp:Transcript_44458/g.113591  ORF Transcript_44458/g.113591 Transcript_44458/m.113591 type:complete len:80 (-) Transcript_44458:1384-1623(-)
MLSPCAQNPSISGGSHLGGFLCGLLSAALLLPKVRTQAYRWRGWEVSLSAIAVGVLLVVYVGAPTYLYTFTLRRVSCPQ